MIIVYRVAVSTPRGLAVMDVPSTLGPDAATRRAVWTAIAQRWGDVDEVTATSTVRVCGWFLACDREATGTTPHPILGDVPTCDRCAALAAR